MDEEAPQARGLTKAQLAVTGIAAIAVLAVGALVYFSMAGGDSQPPAEVAVDDNFEAAAEEVVAAAKLTPADLPPGWVAQPQDEDDDMEPELTGECEVLNQEELPGQLASADSDELVGPQRQRVYTTAVAFPSEDAAANAIDTYDSWTGPCRGQMAVALGDSIRDSLMESGVVAEDASTVDVGIDSLDFDGPRDGTKAIRVDWSALLEGAPAGGSMDFFIWQEGDLLGGFVYISVGDPPDPEDQELIADAMAEKLAAAAAFLPT